MIYELRHYVPTPGRESDILSRFENYTFDIFNELGFKVLDFWIETEGSRHLWYVLEWQSVEELESKWNVFRTNSKWLEVKSKTEANGPIVENVESIRLKRLGGTWEKSAEG